MEKFKLKIKSFIKEKRMLLEKIAEYTNEIPDNDLKKWNSGRIMGMLDVIKDLEKICNEKM